MSTISTLQQERYSYRPKLPAVYSVNGPFVTVQEGARTTALADEVAIERAFPRTYGRPMLTFAAGQRRAVAPLRVGVILSGGQAPGGHNVIAGLLDGLKAVHPESELVGFLGGPSGLTDNKFRVLDTATLDAFRNTGGFDLIGSGRTKLEKAEQFDQAAANCRALKIDAVVIIGGDDSNTNAGVLAEYFEAQKIPIRVIGCPKTIDGDLKNEQIEISFGFDTATKLYSELIGNIARDANSAKKYWHFVKLMGRSASHVTLECALQTHPNVALISEEVAEKKQTLRSIVTHVAGVVRDRAAQKRNFGVVLVPEGLIEFIPEIKLLIGELNDLLAVHEDAFNALTTSDDRLQFVSSKLTAGSAQVFNTLPGTIKLQLLADRDSHGQVQVSRIETEKLLLDLVNDQLCEWAAEGKYPGSFSAQTHFLGYEGRCAAPSNFDADYCYSLGYTAVALVLAGKTGYMASVRRLCRPAAEWVAGGVPLTMMMNIERRKGKDVPVIRKCLVDLNGKPFKAFSAARARWALETEYVYPGPIQYFGPSSVADAVTCTLQLEQT
jgi:pyrophosphate--fructose-6-phosphate 1-phosphotransferase